MFLRKLHPFNLLLFNRRPKIVVSLVLKGMILRFNYPIWKWTIKWSNNLRTNKMSGFGRRWFNVIAIILKMLSNQNKILILVIFFLSADGLASFTPSIIAYLKFSPPSISIFCSMMGSTKTILTNLHPRF